MPAPTGFGFVITRKQPNPGVVQQGGHILPFKANATALNIGDTVYIAGVNTVDKSATVGNHTKVAGVVCGGAQTRGECLDNLTAAQVAAGVLAANAGEEVFVMVNGIYWIISGAAITAGDQIKPDTGTAGRAITATPTTDAGKILGKAIETAGAGGVAINAVISTC